MNLSSLIESQSQPESLFGSVPSKEKEGLPSSHGSSDQQLSQGRSAPKESETSNSGRKDPSPVQSIRTAPQLNNPFVPGGPTFEAVVSTNSQVDLPAICKPGKLMRLRNKMRSSCASSQASVDDGVYISPKRSRKNRQSLSSIGNNSTPELMVSNDEVHSLSAAADKEMLAWDIINREVSDWQHICQTGRPSWWSTTSKWTASGRRHSNSALFFHVPLPYHPGFDSDKSLKTERVKRQAVTDSYLANDDNIQDLVHLIALQLLGACFTLPPEHMARYKSFNGNCNDASTLYGFPDSELISCLKMHTNRRYSPSFGHDAKNSSPTQFWQGEYDGSSLAESPGKTFNTQTDEGNSWNHSRRRKVHRTLRNSENSASFASQNSYAEADHTMELLRTVAATTLQCGKDRTEVDLNLDVLDPQGRLPKLDSPVTRIISRDSHRSTQYQSPRKLQRGDQPNNNRSLRSAHSTRYTLEPIIRSEPHPLFIQPVKELVVKHWNTFRKRFGQSVSHGCPDPSATFSEFLSQHSSASSSPGSRRSSIEGKNRRRDARERHEIHGSIAASSPRHVSPASSSGTQKTKVEYIDIPKPPPFKHVDSREVMGGAGGGVMVRQDTVTSRSLTLTPSDISNVARALCQGSRTESGFFSNVARAKSVSSNSPSFRPRRQAVRGQRRSMLSEMCTADDIDDTASVRALAPLLNPNHESGPGGAAIGSDSVHDAALFLPHTDHHVPDTMSSSPIDGGAQVVAAASGRRPRLERMSTSGTQLFRPSEDGVEVDGLPVGPSVEVWDGLLQENGRRQRREPTYL